MNYKRCGNIVLRVLRSSCSILIGAFVMYYGATLYGRMLIWTTGLGPLWIIRLFPALLFGGAIGFAMSIFAVYEESRLNLWMSGVATFLSLIGAFLGNFFATLYVSVEDQLSWTALNRYVVSMLFDLEYLPTFFSCVFNNFSTSKVYCCIFCVLGGGGMFSVRSIPSCNRKWRDRKLRDELL